MFQAVRGTSDLLPAQLSAYRQLEHKAMQLAEKYGFQEIRTPLFEKADLFVRGLGVMASIVERELWTFNDKHGQKLALRADMTPCVVRAYQQHRMNKESGLTKLSYVGPVFLLGKEGNEPSRQAHQFGVEVLGNDSPALDTELLVMALEFCEAIGLTGIKLEINSLGCEKCRPAYHDALREFFASRQNELCQNCKRKYRNHPAWVLSCPEAGCESLANLAPTILGLLCQDCKTHFNSLKHLLQELDLEVSFNPRVVRDLEYYNSTVFRISVNGRTVGMGGRYDGLVQQLGGSDTPAAGFAMYLDELVALLPAGEAPAEDLDFLFLPEGPESTKALLPVALRLRKAGARVEVIYQNQGELPEARWHIKLAEVNALRGQVEIVDQDSRQQEKCSAERLLARLQHMLGQGQRDGDGEGRGARRRLNRLRGKDRDRDRELQRRPHDDPPPPSHSESGEETEEAGEGDGEGRRRKRRRRRRGEGEDNAPEPQATEDREEPRRERGRQHEDRPERQDRDRDDRPERNERPERFERPSPTPRQEPQPAKAFIPSLSLAGGKVAPPVAKAKPAPKVEEAKAGSAPAAALGNLNWSIKTKANGQSVDDEPDNAPQGQDRALSRRRPARRR
ncbi:MAG: histidine--tRNA ligase [Candidatus Eremiobacteraeota bacterium]|nr:histidine--tRNA ligase [Candidatus Eremiobacteraeota bacterium]MCW5870000.1 histidine--tRNA ligase [Candidatus Eremiobacteraeota bacterium]